MSDVTQLLYLEPDDEITTVVRRLRETDAARVVLVASGRSKATTSSVALRLLAQLAADDGREIALVADTGGRALAADAGIAAFASVADASGEDAVPLAPAPPRRAPIHVVRGEAEPVAPPPPPAPPRAASGDETQAVRLPTRPAPAPRLRAALGPGRPLPRAAFGALIALLLVSGAALAAVAPAAIIRIEAASVPVGPVAYEVRPPVQGPEAGRVEHTQQGSATGERIERTAATGAVTFRNWNTVVVEVPAGTVLSVGGGTRFTTTETVLVPSGQFTPEGTVRAGEASAGVVAAADGPAGNVPAEAIDTVENRAVMTFLRGFPNNRQRLVLNPAPTAGGAEEAIPVITQEDVDAAAAALAGELERLLAEAVPAGEARLYPPAEPPAPAIDIPEGLVGTEGEVAFTLDGTLDYSRPYLLRADAVEEARLRLLEDAGARPAGTSVLEDSLQVEVGAARLDSEGLIVEVTVRAEAVHQLDADAIRQRVAGLTPDEVVEALGDVGQVRVELWPPWVDRVPGLSWRVTVEVTGA